MCSQDSLAWLPVSYTAMFSFSIPAWRVMGEGSPHTVPGQLLFGDGTELPAAVTFPIKWL